METRTITQVKMYVLVLNPMTGQAEGAEAVAMSDDRQRLVNWYNSQKAPERYNDDERWNKMFIKGGPLEWFNGLSNIDSDVIETFGQGVHETWAEEHSLRTDIPRV